MKRSYDKSSLLGVKLPGGTYLRAGESFIPQPHHAYQPMTFADTVTALQAKKVCKWVIDPNSTREDDGHFEITGIHDRSRNWQIPFVRCNSKLCTEHGQDATDFCEFSMFVIAGTNPEGAIRATQFNDWIYQRYPALATNDRTAIVRKFEYQEDDIEAAMYPTMYGKAIDKYIKSPDYGRRSDMQKISMAIVFDGNDPHAYLYAIRQNLTNFNVVEDQDSLRPGSRTSPKTTYIYKYGASSDLGACSTVSSTSSLNSGDLGVLGTSCTGQYMYNGVLAAQRLVHDFILYDTGSVDAGYSVAEAGVQFVQFPQANYDPDGFFKSNKSTCCFRLN
jgi:hypothetical protein